MQNVMELWPPQGVAVDLLVFREMRLHRLCQLFRCRGSTHYILKQTGNQKNVSVNG